MLCRFLEVFVALDLDVESHQAIFPRRCHDAAMTRTLDCAGLANVGYSCQYANVL
jgi:hypothetical protein